MTSQRRIQTIAGIVERYDLQQKLPYPHYENLHSPNEWYGHAHSLKKYCSLPETMALPFVVEHGWLSPLAYNDTPGPEKESSLPFHSFLSIDSGKIILTTVPLPNSLSTCKFPLWFSTMM